MSAETIVRRILRNELPDGVSLSKEKAMASVNHFVRVFNKFLAEGLSLEAEEVNLTEAIRQEVVAQGFWDNAEDEDKGVAPEPAALTDKVVKCAVLEVMEQRHLAAGDDAVAEDLDLTELPSAVAKHLGESDGGERLGKDFLPAMIEATQVYLRRLKLKPELLAPDFDDDAAVDILLGLEPPPGLEL